MPEPATVGITAAVSAYLGKDAIKKLLGPTADYLGDGLKDLTKKRIENIAKIFEKAEKKLGSAIDSEGEVPARVLKAIINEASYNDDELAAEYFGGVLASSRTELGRDDRGARIAKILDGLSTYQIRTHYLIYGSINHLYKDSGLPFNMEGRPKMESYFPFGGFKSAMEFNEHEFIQFQQLLNHIFFGLASENLIEPEWRYSGLNIIKKEYPLAKDGGIICTPSALGAELFLWAFGKAERVPEFILDKSFEPVISGIPSFVEGTCVVSSLKK